jgi:hypothetical protein
MFKLATIFFTASICGVCFSQSPITLGVAKPIDIHVVDAKWQPAGQALIYKREEEAGFSLGIYGVGHREGKVVIPIQKEDTWDTNWLADSNSALVVVRGPAKKATTKSTQIRIYLVDGKTQSARQFFDQTYEDKAVPSVEVDASPGLKHAIVTFRRSPDPKTKGPVTSTHMVLTAGGGSFVASPDLDKAEKEGLSGPNWSLDGTAIYSNLPQNQFRVLARNDKAATGDKVGAIVVTNDGAQTISEIKFAVDIVATNAEATGVLSGSGREEALTLNFVNGIFKIGPPMPKTGTSVLELMPANPILRPVRFRGPWVNSAAVPSKVVNRNQSIVLHYDQSNAQDNSVWLTTGPEKGSPATLVAVHASKTWLSEQKNSIAYLIDGALFFRSIGK